MNQYSQQKIRQYNKPRNIPLNLIEKDCLIYKELIFDEENNKEKYVSYSNKLSEGFVIENSIKEDEGKNSHKRNWKANDNNKKEASSNIGFKKYKIKSLTLILSIF